MPAFFMPICTFVPFSYLLYNKNESEVFSLKKQKYYINLTDRERSEILSSLLIKKNKLTHQGKFTDGIDEVICKLMKAHTKLFKVKIV